MAMKTKPRVTDAPGAIPDVFDSNAQYEVKLNKNIEVSGVVIRPYQDLTLKGRVCEANRDALVSATKKS